MTNPAEIRERLDEIKPMLNRGVIMAGAWFKHAPWLHDTCTSLLEEIDRLQKQVDVAREELTGDYNSGCSWCIQNMKRQHEALSKMDAEVEE